ncbi:MULTISPECIES: enhanced intracellular survival protein Eis [unclassified Lysinibacillus]|uniref:GNAT family N-acetyltransferase n=1 Tax=unclassified Lysinibacillus TaxID=2636778 RepID=UPI0037F1C2D3
MRIVKKLLQEDDILKYVNIVIGAYPGVVEASPQTTERLISVFKHNLSNEPSINYYGLWEDNDLLGCMRIHDFEMNLFSKIIPIGGVGQVAVDLLHKKERIAKELIEYFYKIFLEKEVHIVALYPFRPDFYKKMGFGYGPKMYQYLVEPSSFPKGPTKQHIKYVSEQDQQQVADCYNRIALKKHGMFFKTQSELTAIFKNKQNYIIAVEKDDYIEGYVVFSFKKQSETNFMLNNLVIKEFIYETPEALLELSTFLNSQADQINRIEWNTQDDNIHFFLGDVRNGSNHLIPSVFHANAVVGIGLMYRIINVRGFFQELKTHNFNNSNLTVKLTVTDSLLAENNQNIILQAVDGYIEMIENESYDVEMIIDIAELSSLMMGVVTVQDLFMLGKVKISDSQHLQALYKLFFVLEKPMCLTAF